MPDDNDQVHERERWTPVALDCDVVVVGGGPAGVCAAVAAARSGAETALVERAPFLGGTATGAMVASFMGFFCGHRRVTGGIPFEITRKLIDLGGGDGFYDYTMADAGENPLDVRTFPLDPELLKIALDDLVSEAGVHTFLHTQAAEPIVKDGVVSGVFMQGRSERKALRAKVVVDASADGLVAYLAGAEVENRKVDPRTFQPMTQMAHFADVDMRRFRSIGRSDRQRLASMGMESGALSQKILSVVSSPHGDDAIVLMTRISGRNGADESDLARAEMEGRRHVLRLAPFLRENVPGFEKSKLINLASWIGVRETWRIIGDYVLTQDDVLSGRRFDDGVALGGGPLDVHHTAGGGITLTQLETPFATPYRCLLPVSVDGLVMAGRCISATREAMGAVRHMGSVMTLGHAAGVGAALAAADGIAPREVDVEKVRAVLGSQGAILNDDDVIAEAAVGRLN